MDRENRPKPFLLRGGAARMSRIALSHSSDFEKSATQGKRSRLVEGIAFEENQVRSLVKGFLSKLTH
jgi:hypothetical protein